MRNREVRITIILILTLILAIACVVRLFDLQIINGSKYEQQANDRLYRAYSIPAPRGEILDRNGNPLVENRMGYSIQIQQMDLSNDEFNDILCKTAYLAAEYGAEIESSFPVVINGKNELEYDFTIEKDGGVQKVSGVKLKKTAVSKKDDDGDSDDDTENEKSNAVKTAEEKEKAKEANLETWKKDNNMDACGDALPFSCSGVFCLYQHLGAGR